jgi:hypothetical protein
MTYVREEVRGTTGQDIMKINENFMNIFEKVFGDINFSDTDTALQNSILTQYIPFQGDGNLDKTYPLYVRFYVPPNIKTIKGATLNAFVENYRMDSDVTKGGGGVAGGSVNLSISGGGSCTGEGYTASKTAYVTKWGTPPYEYEAPTKYLIDGNMNGNMSSLMGGFLQSTDKVGLASVILSGMHLNKATPYADLKNFQHSHELPPISVSVSVPPHSHTGEASVTIPEHTHELKEGIRVSTTAPGTTNVYVNDNKVCSVSSGNATANNIDISQYVKVGEWNIIKVDTTNLARISVYGTIEAIMKYTNK